MIEGVAEASADGVAAPTPTAPSFDDALRLWTACGATKEMVANIRALAHSFPAAGDRLTQLAFDAATTFCERIPPPPNKISRNS